MDRRGLSPPKQTDLRQLPDAQVPELDRRALRLQAEMAAGGATVGPARDLLAVDPEADLAIEAADVVMGPLAHALAPMPGGEAPRAVGRGRREGGHPRRADREDVAVGR